MEMTVEQAADHPSIHILRISGDIDGSNYREVMNAARELHSQGTQQLLIDLGNVRFMSSAGIVALHSIALTFRGQEAPDPEEAGWRAIRAVGETPAEGKLTNVKLLNPQTRVASVLERSGLINYFNVFVDEAEAVASF